MTFAGAAPQEEPALKIRTMVVDDSAVVRGFITRTLESDPRIEVVASCGNGQIAVQQAARQKLDIIILDIEMPVMDGLVALPLLRAARPGAKIIMSSTLTQRNAEISIEALTRGATDYIPKPTTGRIGQAHDFHRDLLDKVLGLGLRTGHNLGQHLAPLEKSRPAPFLPVGKGASPIKLRSCHPVRPKVLAIGSSTGGPQALLSLLGELPPEIGIPILITQHMPATFTSVLAQHIGRVASRPCAEATNGEAIVAGRIYIAPGDYHLELAGSGETPTARLTQGPPENYCRPSVNPLFRSVARLFGSRALGVVLTGMGSDGLAGAEILSGAGAQLIAQDERSSVVWGMPGAVAMAGLCTAVLPLGEIARQIVSLFHEART